MRLRHRSVALSLQENTPSSGNHVIACQDIAQRGRRKGTPIEELGLSDPTLTDKQLLDAMMAHPILTKRPIVVTDKVVKLCRSSEMVLDILTKPQLATMTKEDGEPVDAKGRRAFLN